MPGRWPSQLGLSSSAAPPAPLLALSSRHPGKGRGNASPRLPERGGTVCGSSPTPTFRKTQLGHPAPPQGCPLQSATPCGSPPPPPPARRQAAGTQRPHRLGRWAGVGFGLTSCSAGPQHGLPPSPPPPHKHKLFPRKPCREQTGQPNRSAHRPPPPLCVAEGSCPSRPHADPAPQNRRGAHACPSPCRTRTRRPALASSARVPVSPGPAPGTCHNTSQQLNTFSVTSTKRRRRL